MIGWRRDGETGGQGRADGVGKLGQQRLQRQRQTIGETLRGVCRPGFELDAVEMQWHARSQVERIADRANDARSHCPIWRRRELGDFVEREGQHLERRAGDATEAGRIGIEADIASRRRTDEQARRIGNA